MSGLANGLRILLLTSRLPYPPYRGDKLKIFNLLKQLSRRGHQVTLLSFIESETERSFIPEVKRYCREVRVVHLSTPRSLMNCAGAALTSTPFQVAYFHNERMKSLMLDIVREGAFDVVHVHLIRMAQYGLALEGVPRVLDLTDAGSLYLERFHDVLRNPLKKRAVAVELKRLKAYEGIVNQFERALVCSSIDRGVLWRRSPGAPLGLLHNGIDLEYFSVPEARRPDPNRIICTGNLSYFPNADGVLYFVNDVLPLVRKSIPSAHLYVVGQKPTKEIRSLAGDGVTVTGFVKDIRSEYLASAVAVAPIRFGAGTLNKVLEPMALGLPVVATSVATEGLPLTPGKELLTANNPEEFAGAVVRVLGEPDLARRLGDAAQRVVRERFGWETVVLELENAYLMARDHARNK